MNTFIAGLIALSSNNYVVLILADYYDVVIFRARLAYVALELSRMKKGQFILRICSFVGIGAKLTKNSFFHFFKLEYRNKVKGLRNVTVK